MAALDHLYPLPERLHFTPAMSARALLNGLNVVEIPMSYEERIGESKLSVLRDGVLFLETIFEGVLCYRPERLFFMGVAVCAGFTVLLAVYPAEYYMQNRALLDWMIYRFAACSLLGSVGFLLLCAAVLAHRMATLGPRRRGGDTFWVPLVAQLFSGKSLAVFLAVVVAASLFFLWPGIVEYVTTLRVHLHWSRLLAGSFGLLLAFQAAITGVLLRVIAVWQEKREFDQWADRRRKASPPVDGSPAGYARVDPWAQTSEKVLSDRPNASDRSVTMKFIERLHGGYVHGRRVRRLCDHLSDLIPRDSRVLDVGCGDGLLGRMIMGKRPDIELQGIDVLLRNRPHIPAGLFDGQTIPHDDASFDVVMFVDVLHHTDDPMVLLREAVRVARCALVLKDHTADGLLAVPTLRFMDRVGNIRHGVALPYNYWPRARWLDAFGELGLTIEVWKGRLGLYPIPADWAFGRSLHFIARGSVGTRRPESSRRDAPREILDRPSLLAGRMTGVPGMRNRQDESVKGSSTQSTGPARSRSGTRRGPSQAADPPRPGPTAARSGSPVRGCCGGSIVRAFGSSDGWRGTEGRRSSPLGSSVWPPPCSTASSRARANRSCTTSSATCSRRTRTPGGG